jgi:diadenosine tetraphosphatase ApaH/serine/threonine PP2A family protein phosphatase
MMRVGIFSDVHANLEALQAVLSAYQKAEIDRYICLGDIVGYGANPNECCQLVRDLTDLVVLGNHDAACSGRMSTEWFNSAARAAVEEHQHMLDAAHRKWLAQLPYRIEFGDMLLCHGSPYQSEQFPYIVDETDVEAILHHLSVCQPLIFVGHTHQGTAFVCRQQPAQRIWQDTRQRIHISPDHTYFFNVGSVGQPRDGDWRPSYAILDTEARTFELQRTEYDVDTASEKIARLGFPLTLSERLFLGL